MLSRPIDGAARSDRLCQAGERKGADADRSRCDRAQVSHLDAVARSHLPIRGCQSGGRVVAVLAGSKKGMEPRVTHRIQEWDRTTRRSPHRRPR